MKNLHVLPTDKPSRLMIDTIENKLYLQPILHEKTINILPQNIYITNDEEIKRGDWFLDIISNTPHQAKQATGLFNTRKKIILTTDQDLIKDGVQGIDDEFLEWFVKNPSCEEIKVESYSYMDKNISESEIFTDYKIIIPQEEPKQEKHICKYCKAETTQSDDQCYAKPKQETLNEAAINNYPDGDVWTIEQAVIRRLAFMNGAKWQAQRMYSEEEVNNIFDTLKRNSIDNVATITNVDLFIKSWKREFKKG